MKVPDIKECIRGNVTFSYYRGGQLWYSCENGFLFPVPVEDIGDATFLNVDRAMLFMRYVRKYINELMKSEEVLKG